MKQLDSQVFDSDKIVLEKQAEVKKGLKLIGHMKMQPGQNIFELNLQTSFISVVNFEEVVVNIKGGVHKKVVLKENCLYVPAINIKNAEKKFLKML